MATKLVLITTPRIRQGHDVARTEKGHGIPKRILNNNGFRQIRGFVAYGKAHQIA
jgi:hypothetical protein